MKTATCRHWWMHVQNHGTHGTMRNEISIILLVTVHNMVGSLRSEIAKSMADPSHRLVTPTPTVRQ